LTVNNYREEVNKIIKHYLYTLEYTNLNLDFIERTIKVKPIKLSDFVSVGDMATDILRLFGKLEENYDC